MQHRRYQDPTLLKSDATLEALIRAACEADALEDNAGLRLYAAHDHPYARRVSTASVRRSVLRRTAIAAGLAMAACLVWQVAMPLAGTMQVQDRSPALAGIRPAIAAKPLQIEFAADATPRDDRCVARFTGTANEGGALLALFRAWDRQCGCRTWRLYRWDDGNAIARVRQDESLKFALDVSDMPPTEQLLVVAVASNPETLPGSTGEAEELLACLNSSPLEMQHPEDLAEFASAVETCLPGAAIVAHPFSTE